MTTEVPPPAGRGKVPVFDTAVDSFYFVFSNLGRFFALGWLPFVMSFVASMTSGFLTEMGAEESRSISLFAISWAMYAVFAVRWHRFFLLNERVSDDLGARNWRFLRYTVFLLFAPVVPMLVIGLIGFGAFVSVVESQGAGAVELALILLFGLSGFAAFVMLRFSFVLPGTAVDRPLGLGEAWRNMRGNSWRFIGAIILVAVPSVILILIRLAIFGPSLFGDMTGGAPPLTIGVVVATKAVGALIGFFVAAAAVTVLSKFYRHIVGMETGEDGAAAGP